MALPLDGVKVVELTVAVAGPAAAMILWEEVKPDLTMG
eukprot:COSAG04_NODE_9310_length_876_cov_0.687259_1_plen_37_part_10